MKKSNKDTIIELYFINKLKPVEIAESLNISKSAVTQVLQKDANYKIEKEERKKFSRQKHNEDTKKIMKVKRTKQQLEKNADDLILKNAHNQASVELSASKRLTNINYRNWNKSAFIYNKKRKGYEFRKELGRSFDVPKFIKVEV